MVAYAIVDVEVHDIAEFLTYQKKIAPHLDAAGGRYLARGGEYRIYEGDYQPRRLLLVEFPSLEAMDYFYSSDHYLSLTEEREACSTSSIIAVKGLSL